MESPPVNIANRRAKHPSLMHAIAMTLETEGGLHPQSARQLAARIVNEVRRQFCGDRLSLYVSASDESDRASRDAAIRRDYDGTRQSRERLQLRWDISRAQFYRIINGG